MILFLSFILSFFLPLISSSSTQYYLNQNASNSSLQGTQQNPFTDLQQAITTIGSGDFELIFLGDSFTINSTITLTAGSSYLLQPASSEGYFLVRLAPGASFFMLEGSLTFQSIQFQELDENRAPGSYPLIFGGGTLTFNKTEISNISYPSTNLYYFLYAGQSSSQTTVNVVNSNFSSLQNVQLWVSYSSLNIQNSVFTNITTSAGSLFAVNYLTSADSSISLVNNTLTTSYFGSSSLGAPTGFISFTNCTVNMIFQGLTVRNVILTTGFPLVLFNNTQQATGQAATLALVNINLQNIYESVSNLNTQGKDPDTASVFELLGANNVFMQGFTLKNVQFTTGTFFRYKPLEQTLLYNASVSRISIQNSSNANFLFEGLKQVTIGNVMVQNHYYQENNAVFPLFLFDTIQNVTLKDLTANIIRGPLFNFNDVLSQNISNVYLTGASTSASLAARNQYIVSINQISHIQNSSVAYFKNFNIKGFTDMNGRNSSSEAGSSSMFLINSQVGEISIEDSIWENVELNCLLGSTINSLKVHNLTVLMDTTIAPSEVSWHYIFRLSSVTDFQISDSRFLNNPNVAIFSLFDNEEAPSDNPPMINLQFQNLTVLKNTAYNTQNDVSYTSLFMVNVAFRPVNCTFLDSNFQSNRINKGIILVQEANKVNITLRNNTFQSNIGYSRGTAFATENMQSNTNLLYITNNTFLNNLGQGSSGGVFSFINVNYQIIATENIYRGNSALSGSGGVGYSIKSKLSFLESSSVYAGNYAMYGTGWYFSMGYDVENSKTVQFVNTSFYNGSATQSGGALYMAPGNLYLQSCYFSRNRAVVAGADIYLMAFSSLTVEDTESNDSCAPQGCFLYAESYSKENISITDSFIHNTRAETSITTVIELSSGNLQVKNTNFTNSTASLFKLDGTSARLENVQVSTMNCQIVPFCIIQANAVELAFKDSKISNIISTRDLMVLNSQIASISLDNIEVSNVLGLKEVGQSFMQLFGLRASYIKGLELDSLFFKNFTNTSGITLQSSSFDLNNSRFTNNVQQQKRILQETNNDFSGQQTLGGDFVYSQENYTNMAQFLVLTSSNGTITFTDFNKNSHNTSYSGGAIYMTSGAQANYEIYNSTFENNYASKGGAIYIEGPITSLTLSDTNFSQNIASSQGGAIYFANKSIDEVPVVKSLMFEGNRAQYGGAAFMDVQSMSVDLCYFNSNFASQDGGAMASYSDTPINESSIQITNSTFYDNQVSTLRSLGVMNFEISEDNIFINTTSGQLVTNPTRLGLVIYQVDEYFLFIDNVSFPYMISHPDTKIVYNSQDPNFTNQIIIQQSGISPHYLFEFSYLDEFNQSVPSVTRCTLTLTIQSSVIPKNGILPGLLGRDIYNFNQTTNYVFNSFFIRGSQNTEMVISASATYTNTFNQQVTPLPPIFWNATLDPCQLGGIYDSDLELCVPCGGGTYSVTDPYTTNGCTQCTQNMSCLGGSTVFPEPGFWRISATSLNFVQCFNSDACLGGQLDNGMNISLTGFCGVGYEGVGCATCSQGYAKFGSGETCVNCSQNAGYYIRFLVYLIIQIFIIGLVTKAFLVARKNNYEVKYQLILAALLKVLIDFIQVLNLTWELSFNWPAEIKGFLEAVTKVIPANKDALSIGCFITLSRNSNQNVFFIKALVLILEPLMFILAATVFWMLFFKYYYKESFKHNLEFKKRLTFTSMAILYIMQPGILKTTLQLFNCRNYGPEGSGMYYLVEDTDVKCWSQEHYRWALGLGIPSLIIWFLIPTSCLLVYTYHAWKNTQTIKGQEWLRYNFVFNRYHLKAFYWEILILTRKVLIIVFGVFLTFDYLQPYLCCLVIMTAYALQVSVKPFNEKLENDAENLCLLCIFILLFTGLFFVRDTHNEVKTWVNIFLAIIDILVIILMIFYSFVLFKRAIPYLSKEVDRIFGHHTFGVAWLKKIWAKIRPPPRREDPEDANKQAIGSETPQKPLASYKSAPYHLHSEPPLLRGRSSSYTEATTCPNETHLQHRRSTQRSSTNIYSRKGSNAELLGSTPSHKLPTVTGANSQEKRFSVLSDAALKSLLTMGSLTELDSKEKQQEGAEELDPVIEEQLHAPMKKDSLIDNRFKDLEMVHFQRSGTEDTYAKKKKKKTSKQLASQSLDLKPAVFKIQDLSGFSEDYEYEKRLDTVEEESIMIPIQKSRFIDERFKNLEMIKLHTSEPSEYPPARQQQQFNQRNLPKDKSHSDIDEEEEESKMITIQKSRFRDDRFKNLEMIHLQTSEASDIPLKPQQLRKLDLHQKTEDDEITPIKKSRFADDRFKNLDILRLESSDTGSSLKKLMSNKETTMTLDSLQDLEVNEESQSLSIAQGLSQTSLIKREDEKPMMRKRERVKQSDIKSRAKMLRLESFEDNEEYARFTPLSSQSTPIALLKMLTTRNNERFADHEPIKIDIEAKESQNTERSGNNEGVLTLSMVEENQEEEQRPDENDEDFLPFSPEESKLKDVKNVQNPFTLDDILSDGYEIMKEKKKSDYSLDEYEEEMKNKYHVTISLNDEDKENYEPNWERYNRK